jgi:hypothetical protein
VVLRRVSCAVLMLGLLGARMDSVHASNLETAVSAARPGVSLEQSSTDLGSQWGAEESARRALTSGEGSGPKWCAEYGGYQLGAVYGDVYACGPANGTSDDFDTAGFQCVELSERFMWVTYSDFVPNVPDGRHLVSVASSYLGVSIGTPGTNSLPVPGDVVSMWGGPNALVYGHTGVVTGVDVDSSGNGTIEIMDQNALATGWDEINVTNWSEAYGDPNYDGGLYYYNHVEWLELASAPPPPGPLQFSATPIGSDTSAAGIAPSGTVTGLLADQSSAEYQPFLYSTGSLTTLPNPAGDHTPLTTVGISSGGAVAAAAHPTNSTTVGYVLPAPGQQWGRLPAISSDITKERLTSIDATGDVAGWASTVRSRKPTYGVLWMHRTGEYRIRLLDSNRYFHHPVLNESDSWGDAVGYESRDDKSHATIWASWKKAYRLPIPSSTVDDGSAATGLHVVKSSTGRALTIVGWIDNRGVQQAAVWTAKIASGKISVDSPTLLQMPDGYGASMALATNSAGWIVGNVAKRGSAGRVFLYRPGFGTVDLDTALDPTSGWVALSVKGLNPSGDVVVNAYNRINKSESDPEALVLTPSSTVSS